MRNVSIQEFETRIEVLSLTVLVVESEPGALVVSFLENHQKADDMSGLDIDAACSKGCRERRTFGVVTEQESHGSADLGT